MSLLTLASLQAPSVSESNLRIAQSHANSSIGRLSSGNAIIRSGDDVANLSISTRMQMRISSIRSALVNTLQATSLLQVADGGLSQIGEILNRMNALSTQSNGGAMTNNERGFLNLEFQQLKQEIDHISASTNFNGVNVLATDKIAATNSLRTDSSVADKASAIVNFTQNPANGDYFEFQSIRFRFLDTPGTNPLFVQRGATIEESLTNLLKNIETFPANNHTNPVVRERYLRLQEATYERVSDNSFKITSVSGGELARNIFIDEIGSNPGRDNFEVLNAIKVVPNVNPSFPGNWILNNNDVSGLSMNDVQPAGQTDGSLIELQNQKSGEFRINFTGVPSNGSQLRIDNGVNGTQLFVFNTTISPTDINSDIRILRAATIEETIDNAVIIFNEFTENQRVDARSTTVTRQLEYYREGTALVARYKGMGNATDINENNARFVKNDAFIIFPNGTTGDNMINGVNEGVDTQGVINPDFYGKLTGFEAELVSLGKVKLSITVGESTYTAQIEPNFPSNGYKARMVSDDGGFFDIPFRSGSYEMKTQDDADSFASDVEQAMSGLTFYQKRAIDSFGAGGILTNTSLEIRLDDFDTPLAFQDVVVESYEQALKERRSGASIQMTINGETFRSVTEIEDTISPYQKIILQSDDNAERQIIFTNNRDGIDINSPEEAQALQKAFFEQLPIGDVQSGQETIFFALDASDNQDLSYTIKTISLETLFENPDNLSIGTVEDAVSAGKAIEAAIDILTSRRAYVGSLQSRADFLYSSLESSVVVHESARAIIADTDISSEATAYAQSQVQIQSSIAVGAQSNVLRSTVLDIVDAGMVDQNFLVRL